MLNCCANMARIFVILFIFILLVVSVIPTTSNFYKEEVSSFEDIPSAMRSTLDFSKLLENSDMVEFIGSYVPLKLPRLRSMSEDEGDHNKVIQLMLELPLGVSENSSVHTRRHFPISVRPIAGVVSSMTNVSTVSWNDGRKPFDATLLMNRLTLRYEGRLDDDPHSLVSGHFIHGLFSGFMSTNNETYFVEPASQYFENHKKNKFNAIFYRARDIYLCPRHGRSEDDGNVGILNCFDDSSGIHESNMIPNTGNSRHLRRAHSLPAGFYGHVWNSGRDFVKRRKRQTDRADIGRSTDADADADADAAKVPSTAYLCDLRIISDFRWYRYVAHSNTTYGTELVESLLRRVDQIFRALDIDGDGRSDNVGFVLRDLNIYLDPVLPIYDSLDDGTDDWDPKRFFDEFRHYNFDGACAGLLLTYRRLAVDHRYNVPTVPKTNIASLDQGICSRYRPPNGPVGLLADYGIYVSNALPVNFMSWNRMASASSIVVETAHQLGHLFGARDDGETDDPRCRPYADVSRNYIMAYPLVSAETERNYRWSPCSVVAFETFLRGIELQGRSCLQPCAGPACLRDRWGIAGGTGQQHRSTYRPRFVRADNTTVTNPASLAKDVSTRQETRATTKGPLTDNWKGRQDVNAEDDEANSDDAETSSTDEPTTTTVVVTKKTTKAAITTVSSTKTTCDIETTKIYDTDDGNISTEPCTLLTMFFIFAFVTFILH